MKGYNQTFKLKVVKEYLNGEGSYSALAKKHSISHNSLSRWTKKYKKFGESGLERSTSSTPYTVQFKLNAIELYQTTDISYRELALELGVRSEEMIRQWVKQYEAKGLEGISRTRSGPRKMDKNKEEKFNEISLEGLTEEEIKKKILYLEIENAYLKELRSLKNRENPDVKTKKKPE